MRIDRAIAAVREAEERLDALLSELRDRHEADHDVFHLAQTLQRIVTANLQRLAAVSDRYGVEASGIPDRRGFSAPAEPALFLLGDLRQLHVAYAEASIAWVILGQGAQAVRDQELLEVVSACHPQTLRGLKWTVTRIKVAAPQVLST